MLNSYYSPALLDASGRFSPEKFLECFIKAASLENLAYPINESFRYMPRAPPCYFNPPPQPDSGPSHLLDESNEFEAISSESESESENETDASEISYLNMAVKPPSFANRLKLILDLDNTLLHACARFKLGGCDIPLEDFISPMGECELYCFTLPNLPNHVYYLKLRPGVHQFIEKVSQFCELAIHTNATQEYAEIVKTILDPDGRYFGDRLVARDNAYSCGSKKDLDRLFGAGDDFSLDTLIILDDRMDVWDPMYHPNIIHCGMYDYLDSRKQALALKYPSNKSSANQSNLAQLNQQFEDLAKSLPNVTANKPSDFIDVTDQPFSDNPLVVLSENTSDNTDDCEDTLTQSSFDDNSVIDSNPFLQENALVDYDVELMCITDLIEEVAKEYFNSCQSHTPKNIAQILKEKRSNILRDTIIQTTGMYKLELSHPEHGWHDNGPVHRRRLLALGATVVQTTIPELTHLLVMRATQTLDAIKSDSNYNVHFVHALWLHACESTWSRIPESWFEAFPLLKLYENNPPKKPWVDIWRVLAQQKDWKHNPQNKLKSSFSKCELTTRELQSKIPSLNGAKCWSPFESMNFVYKAPDPPVKLKTSNYSELLDIPSPFAKSCKRRRKIVVN